MINKRRNTERGIAMFFAIFALLLLMAIASALAFMAGIETSVNSNYRQEEIAYFAAKAGIEEARARMMNSDPNTINPTATPLPTTVPTTANSSVVYIVNPGSGSSTSIQPWNSSNTYVDDEICHDGYAGYTNSLVASGNVTAPGVHCAASALPSVSTWYTSHTSQLPFNSTSAALPYKWARITPKLNSSVAYLTSSGGTTSINNYTVNTSVTYTGTTLICWDGAEELPLLTTDTACSQMLTTAGSPMTTVYLVTSLAVSPMGSRKMVQAEAALTPVPPFVYGLYATSNACPGITFSGNNPSTDSYTSVGGGTYAGTHTNTGGDVGANGGVSIGNGNIYGVVGVPSVPCTTPVSVGSNGTMLGTTACPSGNSAMCFLSTPYVFPTPPAPNPVTPNTAATLSSCGSGGGKHDCIAPGTYGNISITKTLTLSPGTYNINSLSMTGNAQILVSPAGAVILNIGGTGQSNPLQIAGNGISDDSTANDFIINYAGTGSVSIAGNGDVTAILNAPNAPVTQIGNGNWYGSMVAATESIGGNAFFHYDKNSKLGPASNGYYTMISYRDVLY